jgi:hypothetical protein
VGAGDAGGGGVARGWRQAGQVPGERAAVGAVEYGAEDRGAERDADALHGAGQRGAHARLVRCERAEHGVGGQRQPEAEP